MSLKAFTLNNQWSFGVDPKYPLVDLTNIYTHTIYRKYLDTGKYFDKIHFHSEKLPDWKIGRTNGHKRKPIKNGKNGIDM